MPDFLTRLREEADRRLDPPDAAALQRELEDHLRASVAAYEEVGHPEPERAAAEALGSPRRLVRAVARRTRRGDGFRLALAASALVGGAYTAFDLFFTCFWYLASPPVLVVCLGIFFICLATGAWRVVRAGRAQAARGFLGLAIGWCLMISLQTGIGSGFGRMTDRTVYSFHYLFALAAERPMMESDREDVRRDIENVATRRTDLRPVVAPRGRLRWVGPEDAEYATATRGEAVRRLRAVETDLVRTMERYDRARPATFDEASSYVSEHHDGFWRQSGGWGLVLLLSGYLTRSLSRPRRRRRV